MSIRNQYKLPWLPQKKYFTNITKNPSGFLEQEVKWYFVDSGCLYYFPFLTDPLLAYNITGFISIPDSF